jgi:hypothetical protein
LKLACYLAHQTDGRTRLRVVEKPEDTQQLSLVAQAIEALEGVEQVLVRHDTGRLVIHHPLLAGAMLLERLVEAGIVLAEQPQRPVRPALISVREGLDRADTLLREASQGITDLRTIGFLALGSLAVVQMMRGQALANGTALMWYAFSLASRASRDDA